MLKEENKLDKNFENLSTASSMNSLDDKFEEIFNDLLPKLANKSSEKSKNYFKLVNDIDNTVVH